MHLASVVLSVTFLSILANLVVGNYATIGVKALSALTDDYDTKINSSLVELRETLDLYLLMAHEIVKDRQKLTEWEKVLRSSVEEFKKVYSNISLQMRNCLTNVSGYELADIDKFYEENHKKVYDIHEETKNIFNDQILFNSFSERNLFAEMRRVGDMILDMMAVMGQSLTTQGVAIVFRNLWILIDK